MGEFKKWKKKHDLERYAGHSIPATEEYKRSILSLMNCDYRKRWEDYDKEQQ